MPTINGNGDLRRKHCSGVQVMWVGAEYTEEQTKFILTMGDLKRRLGRPPTDVEILQEAKALGYRRVVTEQELESAQKVSGG